MAGHSSQHHVDWLGYCLGDCARNPILAPTNGGIKTVHVAGLNGRLGGGLLSGLVARPKGPVASPEA
jgi:hypothetical protein